MNERVMPKESALKGRKKERIKENKALKEKELRRPC